MTCLIRTDAPKTIVALLARSRNRDISGFGVNVQKIIVLLQNKFINMCSKQLHNTHQLQ